MAKEWIPTKYPPEEDGIYLVYIHAPKKDEDSGHEYTTEQQEMWSYVTTAWYFKDRGMWAESLGDTRQLFPFDSDLTGFYVSHWMPMPDSPISLGVDYEQ